MNTVENKNPSVFVLARTLVADGLSLLRVLLTLTIYGYVLLGNWFLAFATLVIAWGTDLADGLAARRWGSLRTIYPKLDSDGIADTVLAFGSALVPLIYTWAHAPSGWTVILVQLYLVSVVLGIMMVQGIATRPRSKEVKAIVTINMIAFHGLLQIGAVTLWFAYMALGWPGVGLTAIVLVVVAIKQQHKLMRWAYGSL